MCGAIMFYKNELYGAVMLHGHVHVSHEAVLVEKWKQEQWDQGIPTRIINVGCMMDYMCYTPRTLKELLQANPLPDGITRRQKVGVQSEEGVL